jgi:hypothetical protein
MPAMPESCSYCSGCPVCDYDLPLVCNCQDDCSCSEPCAFPDCRSREPDLVQVLAVAAELASAGCTCEGMELTFQRGRHGLLTVSVHHNDGCPLFKYVQKIRAAHLGLN